MASAESTSLVRPSHLFPTSIITESFEFIPEFFITLSHLPRLINDSRFSRSNISSITCASSQKGLRIYQQSALPLRSKKLTATFLPETVTFLTPQSTPMVVMYFCTKRPSQQRLMMHDLPTLVSPTEINCLRNGLLSAIFDYPPSSNCESIILTLRTKNRSAKKMFLQKFAKRDEKSLYICPIPNATCNIQLRIMQCYTNQVLIRCSPPKADVSFSTIKKRGRKRMVYFLGLRKADLIQRIGNSKHESQQSSCSNK